MYFDTESQGLFARGLGRILRVFFKHLYNEFAWAYNTIAGTVSAGRWENWATSLLPYLDKDDFILELGHGTGHLVHAAQGQGLRLVALDASRNMGRITYRRVTKKGFCPLLVNGYAQYLPFLPDQFTKIVATFPSEYIIAAQTILEIKRTLTPAGELLVIPAAYITGTNVLDRTLARIFQLTRQAPHPYPEGSLYGFSDPLEQAGFHIMIEEISVQNSTVLLLKATHPG